MDKSKCKSIENEINAIRVDLYEQTKDMTEDERVNFFNANTREILKEYGINVKFADTPNTGASAIRY